MIFLHGFGWHIGCEVWVSLALGPLNHCLHHLPHLIVTCFGLAFLGWVVHRCHTLLHFYPSLFLHFLLHPFIICLIPFRLLLSSLNVVSLYERRVLWCTSPIIWRYSFGCRLSHLAHMILWYLALHTGVWHLVIGYLGLCFPSFHSPFWLLPKKCYFTPLSHYVLSTFV